jgi:hypothetical protein
MQRQVHPSGLQARHSYDQLVQYLETDPTKIKFPDRKASFRRNHPFLTQDDGSKAALHEQKRAIDYRMSDERGPYQPQRSRFEAPSSRGSDYDPSEDLFDMFARSQPPPMAPASAPNTDQSALAVEGLAPPPAPSMMSQMTSRVGENVTQGALNAVSQYSQDTAAAALGWMGRGIADTARFQADFYMNELPAMVRQRAIEPYLDPDRFLAPREGMWNLPQPQVARGGMALRNAEQMAIQDAPQVIGAAAEASAGAGLVEGAEMGAMAGAEAGPLGILAGGLGGAALAGGSLMLGGSLFHNAELTRSAGTIASESLAHRAGSQNQAFQDFNTLNGLNHSIPADRGGRRFNIATPPSTRPPSPTADEMLDQMLDQHARRGGRRGVVPSTYGALRDQVGVASSSASGGPSRLRRGSSRASSHRGPG